LLWAFIGVALACCAKLTVLPYGGLLLLLLAAAAVGRRDQVDWAALRRDRPALVMLVLCLAVGFTILLRTWLLSGLPTIGPDPLVSLWNALGWRLREPAGTLVWLRPLCAMAGLTRLRQCGLVAARHTWL
jgi:hypothetical protein